MGQFRDAGEILAKAGMIERPIERHDKGQCSGDAAGVVEEAGPTKLAAGICRKAGWSAGPPKIAERAGATALV